MAYNLMFARKVASDNESEYWGYKLYGNNKCFTRTHKTELRENSRIGFLEACNYAVMQANTLMEFKEIPTDKVILHINTALYWKYIKYFDTSSTEGIKPPKEYFDAAYAVFEALEALSGGYSLQFSPWAKSANALVTDRAWEKENRVTTERATDVFNSLAEEE